MTPAATLTLLLLSLIAGAAGLVRAATIAFGVRRVPEGPAQNRHRWLLVYRTGRIGLFGLGLVGFSLAWVADERLLAWALLAVGLEELYEGTMAVGIMTPYVEAASTTEA